MARIKETRTDCTQNNWTKGPGKPQARKYWRQILKEMTERHKGRKKERKKESERNRENQNKKMNDENKKKKSNPGQNEAIDKRRRWMPDTFVYVGEIMVENNNNDNKKKTHTHAHTHNSSEKRWFSMKRCGQMGPSFQGRGLVELIGVDAPTGGYLWPLCESRVSIKS